MRPGLLSVIACAGSLAFVDPAAAQDGPEARLAAHAACAQAGKGSGTCSGILTTYCLETAADAQELAVCRAVLSVELEVRAAQLSQRLTEQGGGVQAREIAAGAMRVVTGFCSMLHRRGARRDALGHEARCAMMEAHVTVYHLIRALAEMEQKI